ncbi:cyclin-J [Neocloeon triangulifer]|uniref:cyclin-J n=1 Tax=Neocloeon triangulifer TaxID=2078957 RepID=UPI00286EEE18|nr:cyclin-J [Neocloeon triangulifer]
MMDSGVIPSHLLWTSDGHGKKLIMQFCGHAWSQVYERDYFAFLCKHEKTRKENYMMSPQRSYREELVLWMKEVCRIYDLSLLTLHLAAYILDSFMDYHDIPPFRLRFMASVSLALAAKFEEDGAKIPSYAKIYSVNNPSNPPLPPNCVIFDVEWKVFKFMDCNLHIPTVVHFAYYFVVVGLLETDFAQRADLTERELRMALRDELQQSLDDMLQDLWSLKLPPSWMVSASLIYARRHLNILPDWPYKFQELTQLNLETLRPALNLLHKYYSSRRVRGLRNISPSDSGYLSG